MVLYIFSPSLSFALLQVPFWLSVLYLVFGSTFFLFSWVDDVLVLLIEHYVSNVSPFFVFFHFILFWLSYSNRDQSFARFSEVHILMLLFGLATSGYFWEQTMLASVDAIRYLDPSWNDEVAEG